MARVLGVDPGLRTTGVVIAEKQGEQVTIQFAESVTTGRKSSLPQRVDRIYSFLEDVVDRYGPETLVLEKLYSHKVHPVTATLLGHVRGVIVLLASRKNMRLVELAATRIKQSVTSYGRASKTQVQKMTGYLLGMKTPVASEHVSDAIALVLTYFHIQKVEALGFLGENVSP